MIVYVAMFLLSVAFMHMATKESNHRKRFLLYVLSFLPFFLISGLRYGLGTDYFRRYTYDYTRMYEGEYVKNLEFGFVWLMKATMAFSPKPFVMFLVTSLMITGFIFSAIVLESRDKVLSICVFFLLGFFFDSMNIMRQFVAISFIFVGILFLVRRKKLSYAVCVCLAATFHSTALIMLVLLVLDYKVLFSPKIFLPLLLVLVLLNTRLMGALEFLLKNTRYNVYFSGKLFKGEVSYLFILENLCFYLLMYRGYSHGYIRDRRASLFLNIQALALLCMCLGSCHMLFIRIALYFSTLQIISVPYYLHHYEKTFVIPLGRKHLRVEWIKVFIICCMLVAFYRTNIQTNVNEVLPYRTIFTKHWLIY